MIAFFGIMEYICVVIKGPVDELLKENFTIKTRILKRYSYIEFLLRNSLRIKCKDNFGSSDRKNII